MAIVYTIKSAIDLVKYISNWINGFPPTHAQVDEGRVWGFVQNEYYMDLALGEYLGSLPGWAGDAVMTTFPTLTAEPPTMIEDVSRPDAFPITFASVYSIMPSLRAF